MFPLIPGFYFILSCYRNRIVWAFDPWNSKYGSTRFRNATEAEKRHRRPWSPNAPTVV